VNKIKNILITQFSVECTDCTEMHGGLSATNYKIVTDDKTYVLKIYDMKKAQASIWTENIDYYMPILIWLNENTQLQGRVVRPIKTNAGDYRFDDDENVYLLFDYFEGETVGKIFTDAQIIEAAGIMACLHSHGAEIPVNTEKIKEDFSVPFCFSLEHYVKESYSKSPDDIKTILQPCLEQLVSKTSEVITLSQKVTEKNSKMVLCHTDAHGFNFIQSKQLVLIDWEGLKLAPAEADLVMFTKKEYWTIFIDNYKKLRPGFMLDTDILTFYILRRKIEDIWAFVEGILVDHPSNEQRERDLEFLSECCRSLDDLWFEL
jgi:spectinomycin phosphotransferase